MCRPRRGEQSPPDGRYDHGADAFYDREVWALRGYEGPSYDQGGYLERGFDDLDWLPEPRIELGPEPC